MVVNRYKGIRSLFMRGKFMRKIFYKIEKPFLSRDAKKIFEEERLFEQVEIETINRCNGECPFCPINRHAESRAFAMMSEELFVKIISQLGEMDYRGNLGLFSNNEPFLDNRIIHFAKIAREKVPNAFIHLYTNGSILTEEKILEIMKYLDRMVIDNYNDALELNETSKIALKLCEENRELDKKIEIHLRKIHEVLYTRAGQAPNNQAKKTFNMPCLLPLKQMVIRPDGKVSLCCNDALGKFTMGDCNSQGLTEIWQSPNFREVRKKLLVGRDRLELCRFCDTFSP